MLVKVIPNKTNKFEEIPFPENFKIITKQRRSTLNPNLFTGFFYWKDNKKEYHADIDSGIVLQEIGWNDWNTKRKSEIAISWIAHVLHPIEGIISLDDIELEKNYFSKWNPLKPNFEIPKAIIKNDEIIEIRYWNREEDLTGELKNTDILIYNSVEFDKNGNIISRKILNTSLKQWRKGMIIIISILSFPIFTYSFFKKFFFSKPPLPPPPVDKSFFIPPYPVSFLQLLLKQLQEEE